MLGVSHGAMKNWDLRKITPALLCLLAVLQHCRRRQRLAGAILRKSQN